MLLTTDKSVLLLLIESRNWLVTTRRCHSCRCSRSFTAKALSSAIGWEVPGDALTALLGLTAHWDAHDTTLIYQRHHLFLLCPISPVSILHRHFNRPNLMSTVDHLTVEAYLGTEMFFLFALWRGGRFLEGVTEGVELLGALVKWSVYVRAIINGDRVLIDNHHSLATNSARCSFFLPKTSRWCLWRSVLSKVPAGGSRLVAVRFIDWKETVFFGAWRGLSYTNWCVDGLCQRVPCFLSAGSLRSSDWFTQRSHIFAAFQAHTRTWSLALVMLACLHYGVEQKETKFGNRVLIYYLNNKASR